MDTVTTLLIMFFLVTMSAFFSATETAFSSLSLTKIKLSAEQGNKKSQLILKLLEDYNKLLTTILVGNNIVNIGLSSIGTVWFISLIGSSGATVSTVVVTIIVLIFGEITPKSLAKESPESFASFSAPIINFIRIILTPVNWLFSQWKKLVSKAFKSKDDRTLTEEELLSLVEEVEHSGGIGEQESELIKNAMELNENDAADIATPRVDVAAIPIDASKEEISAAFAESGYSRLPVYEESIDGIVGIIHQNDFYREINNPDINIDDVMKKPLFVPQTLKIGALLKLLQREKCHMAVVSDEYGGTYGIVTMEDVLEELVGEIWDEHDEVEEDFTQVSDGVYTVSGSADPEETLENLGIDKEVDYATMGGWVMDELNKVPEVGDSFDCDGYTVTVTAVDGMRAETIEIKKDGFDKAAEDE